MAVVVSLEEKRRGSPGIEALLRLTADDLADVDRILALKMQSPVGLIPELAAHLIGAGGKRLRPLLTVAAARLCGYQSARADHVKLAACVEFIHSATLLHDDVASPRPMRSGATRRACWSAISCSPAPSS
jgi:octaprenyl-diphosphate synthase